MPQIPRQAALSLLLLGTGLSGVALHAQPIADAPTGQLQRIPTVGIDRARASFDQARQRLQVLRQQIERADRQGEPAQRAQAVLEYRQILEALRPLAGRMAAAASIDRTPAAERMVSEYADWKREFAAYAGIANVGAFQIEMGRLWSDLTGESTNWAEESAPVTWARLNEKPEDPTNAKLGLPKTYDFATAATQYLNQVRAMDGYTAYADVPEVRSDLSRSEEARRAAFAKLAAAAEGVVANAEADTLDQAKRDRLNSFVEQDARKALAGYRDASPILMRGRVAVHLFDREAMGVEAANAALRNRLAEAATEQWPMIRDRYEAETLPQPSQAQPGMVVALKGVENEQGRTFRTDGYDLTFEANGQPVLARIAPALKDHYDATMNLVGQTTMPSGATYDMVAVVTGTARVEREEPASAPATRGAAQSSTDRATTHRAATRPTTRRTIDEAIVVDVIAMHAGPIAHGIDAPDPAAQSQRR